MIHEDNGFLVLQLNAALYDWESVKEAFEELKKETECCIEEGEYFVVKIKKSADAENYGCEFLNYVLKIMKNRGIV